MLPYVGKINIYQEYVYVGKVNISRRGVCYPIGKVNIHQDVVYVTLCR